MEDNNNNDAANMALINDEAHIIDLPTPPPPPSQSIKFNQRVVERKTVSDLDVHSIIVFTDKAEICRQIPIQIGPGKTLELVIENLSASVDKNSFRIESRSSPVIIQDVTYSSKPSETEAHRLEEELKVVESQQRDMRKQKESLLARQKRLGRQRAVLEKFSDALVTSKTENKVNNNALDCSEDVKEEKEALAVTTFSDAFDPKHMDTLNSFFDVYETQAEKLDEQILTAKEELVMVEKAIVDVEAKLKKLDWEKERAKHRSLSVYIESNEKLETILLLYYIVTDSRWYPSYDIRIINSESKMKITYYAVVEQNTGENWEGIEDLFVSTLQPASGGTVPEIGVQKLKFKSTGSSILSRGSLSKDYQPVNSPQLRHKASSNTRRKQVKSTIVPSTNIDTLSSPSNSLRHNQVVSSLLLDGSNIPEESALNEPERDAIASHNSTQSTLKNKPSSLSTQAILQTNDMPSAFYKLPRPPPIIPSVNTSYPGQTQSAERIVIGYIDMTPQFEYSSVPNRAPYAYLRASATNNSEFVVLPGPANVFIDSNFIGKSELRNVSPGESFTCPIGADPRIRIAYHPMYKYRDGGGPVSSKTTKLTFKQQIELVNTNTRAIRVTVTDQLPLAGEDKIKVNLQEPVIKNPEKCDKSKPIRLTKSNQLEWDLDLAAGEQREIVLKYTVEYPSGEYLDLINES